MTYEAPRKPDIGRIVVVHHPRHEELARQCVNELRGSELRIPVPEPIESGPDASANAQIILENLEENDAVALVAGDGTRRAWAEAVMKLKALKHLESVAKLADSLMLTSVRGGNARDAGRAEHSRYRMNGSLAWMFQNAVRLDAYAMTYAATLDLPAGNQRHIGTGLSYIGIGETAETTEDLTEAEYVKGKPLVRDAMLGLRWLFSDTGFDLIDEGERRRLADITFAKGHCMAKVAKLAVEYEQPRILVCRTGTSRLQRVESAARYLTGISRQTHTLSHRIRIKSPVRMHVDGDPPVPLAENSLFEVGLADETYTILSTRARNPVVDPLNEYAF